MALLSNPETERISVTLLMRPSQRGKARASHVEGGGAGDSVLHAVEGIDAFRCPDREVFIVNGTRVLSLFIAAAIVARQGMQ